MVFCPSYENSSRQEWGLWFFFHGFLYESKPKSCDKWGPYRLEEMTKRKNQTVAERLMIERRFTN